MSRTITRDQLFEGAIVLYDETDRYTAVVQSARREQVNVVDIYGWCETTTTYANLRPCSINHYVLRRLGFEETEPMSTHYTYTIADENVQLLLRRKKQSWCLQVNTSQIHVSSVHQLQLVVWSLTGTMLKPEPVEEDEDEFDELELQFLSSI